MTTMSDHVERADAFLGRLSAWAEPRSDIRALLVVGSFARGEARADSDLDVVLLARDPALLLADTTWLRSLGDVLHSELEPYGRVTSIRARFGDGLEAELSIAPAAWASRPHDSGTLRVAGDGMRVVFDRDGDALQLAAQNSAKMPAETP